MRILHISDLHIRGDMKHNHVVEARLQLARAVMAEGDVLVITGDIVDDGKEDQYAHALRLLLPFKGRIVLVPGNHDLSWLGNFYDKKCHKRFSKLREALCAEEPYMFRTGGVAYGEIITLDSCTRTGSIVDFAQGKVGRWTLWKLKRKLDAMRAAGAISVVALHHNPFYVDWFCRLLDAKQFLGVVLGRADIVLCGHEHKLRHTWYPSGLPETQAQTEFYAADSLQYERTEITAIPVVRKVVEG